MNLPAALVITSIAGSEHPVLRAYAKECRIRDLAFILIGDRASPPDFQLPGCDFFNLERQKDLRLNITRILPEKHYARKNVGYLVAIRNGAKLIIETDDDNHAQAAFWNERTQRVQARQIEKAGWVNVFRYFTTSHIWPRGFALEDIQAVPPPPAKFPVSELDCPIQQGLADENPDVDAIYRLILPLPFYFEKHEPVALGLKSWCPFNSQNTTWFSDAFPLLYLPSYCSFRMTDIWRSFIAQRIAWENSWHVLYHEATVCQERNVHDLMRDFADEIPGYSNNRRLVDTLENLNLKQGKGNLGSNLLRCYESMVDLKVIDTKEIPLVEAWLKDLES